MAWMRPIRIEPSRRWLRGCRRSKRPCRYPLCLLKISGQLKAQQDRYSLDEMLLTLGNSDLSGWLVLSLEGERPAVEAELASNLLDIDAIFPPPPQIQTPVQKAQRESSEILEVDSSGEKAAEPAAPGVPLL